jgi:hypothetical protein
MSANLDWKGCKDLTLAKIISPDPNLITFLINSSADRQKTAKMLPVNETTKESIISLLYDSLRELLEALAIKQGYKIYNHECYTQFLKYVINDETLAYEFDSVRLLRNRLNYYGKKIPLQDAKNRIDEFDGLISKVKNLIKK